MIKKYNILYNDGVEYGTMTFTGKTEEEIERKIQEEIDRNNENNPNPVYHITRGSFKISFMNSENYCSNCGGRLTDRQIRFCSDSCKEIYSNM